MSGLADEGDLEAHGPLAATLDLGAGGLHEDGELPGETTVWLR